MGPIRPNVRRLFRLPLRRPDSIRDDVDAELAFHLETRTAQFVARGYPPEAARQEALVRLGQPWRDVRAQLHRSARQKEHQMAVREYLTDLRDDLRYAWRSLRKRPGFTVIAVATLSLGIGANTALFSAVDALLLRALPFRDPATLMDVVEHSPAGPHGPGSPSPWSYPKFMVFHDVQRAFSSIALYARENFILPGPTPERITGERVSADFLRTLGSRVALGRDFAPDVDRHPGAAHSVIIGNALWQRRFGADPGVLGKLLRVDSASYEIIGVLPAGMRGITGEADLLIPVTTRNSDDLPAWDLEWSMVARRKPGVTIAQAKADADRAGVLVYQATPLGANSFSTGDKGSWRAVATPLDETRVATPLRRSLLVLFGAVAMLLLIACVNLANLLLGHAAARRQEIAVRLAIGATRGRLIRLMVAESLLLAMLGAAGGMALAVWGSMLLRIANPADTLRAQGLSGGVGAVSFATIQVDLKMFAFALGTALLVGLFFGLVPAWQATRPGISDGMRDGSAAGGRGSRRLGRVRRALVIVEVGLAVVLLAGSGLMLRSLANTLAIDPGFRSDHLLTLRLSMPPGAIPGDSLPGFYQLVQQRLATLPGVTTAGLADCAPVSGGCNGTIMTFPDRPASSSGNAMVGVHWVSPNWFSELGVRLKRGRMFGDADRLGGQKVVLINEAAARANWPNEDPLGKTVAVYQGGFHTGATVVGIVSDVRFGLIDSTAQPDVYISFNQATIARMMIFLRTSGPPTALIGEVRRALHEIAPEDPVYDIDTMDGRMGTASAQARLSAALLAAFASVALALAVMGIYGVMAFGVTQRRREIGIRMALGAERNSVLGMVVREGASMAAVGVAIGLAGALALTRILRTLLFQVSPTDTATYVAIVLVIAAAALVATWFPAREAARLEPTEALRQG